jgi:hypothetical protein
MLMIKKYTQILLSQQAKRLGYAIFTCLLCNHLNLLAMDHNGRGTKAIGMANAFVAVSDNCWAINYNPAGLMKVTDFQCSAFIVPEQFGLQELKTIALAAVTPVSFGSIGMTAVKFGFDLYSETEIELAVANKMDRNISVGLSVSYNRLAIARYGTAGSFFICGGFIAQMLEGLDAGFDVYNMTASTIGRTKENIPQVIDLGMCWSPFNRFKISFDIEKDIHYPASIKAGFEQIIYSIIAIRAGTATNPDKYSWGIGVTCGSFAFGYAGYSHPDLGWTHQIEISYKPEK